MTDEVDHDTAWSLVTLAVAGLAIALLLWWVTAAAAGICLTKKEARHLWPKQHIYWYSKDRCWSNRRGPPRNLHIDPVFPKDAMAEETKKPRPTGGAIKIVRQDEYNELDAQADKDVFFDARPFPFWDHHMAYDLTLFETWYRRADYWK